MTDYLRIGILSSPHGVKGEICIYPTTDDLDRFTYLEDCFLDINGSMQPVHVTGCKFKKNMPVLKFDEYNSRDDIEALRGKELYVDRDNAIKLEEGEYFLSDVIGFDVLSEDKKIGVISDYMENEAEQVIFIIKCDDGTEKYILDIPEYILEVDLEHKQMKVNIVKGM